MLEKIFEKTGIKTICKADRTMIAVAGFHVSDENFDFRGFRETFFRFAKSAMVVRANSRFNALPALSHMGLTAQSDARSQFSALHGTSDMFPSVA